MKLFYFFMGMYGIYVFSRVIPLFALRIKAERARQMVVTQPKTYARLSTKRKLVKRQVKNKKNEMETYWEPTLQEPYTYFQKGTAKQAIRVAPGEMKLSEKQAWELESFLYEHESVRVYVDPDEQDSVFLTPGPKLFSWGYLIKSIALLSVPLILIRVYFEPVFAIWSVGICASFFEAWLGQRYRKELQGYLVAAPKPEAERKDNEEEDFLELRPLNEASEATKTEVVAEKRRG
ncbi:hypothetical protein [Lewinella sp. W8]|uniref:hypothetical protein n=1 Tax=Lewinella sp. W8 TaxID=2528208 RepID=UPI00106805CD|nr:hypothetical protein [Lewinella sp. W8]MTB52313.1 hypothetical protein [Lewinella sp. W8]